MVNQYNMPDYECAVRWACTVKVRCKSLCFFSGTFVLIENYAFSGMGQELEEVIMRKIYMTFQFSVFRVSEGSVIMSKREKSKHQLW